MRCSSRPPWHLARLAVGLVLAMAIGCGPSTGGGEPDAGLGEDAGGDDAGPACTATCPVTFRLRAGAETSSAEVRGDFEAGGWEQGRSMERRGDAFEATVELEDGRYVQYKFVVNGSEWITDPENPSLLPDGMGNENSVLRVDCGCSSERFDWRDGIMYFVFLDRFADGDPANNLSVEGVPFAANYQGGDLEGLRQTIEDGYFDDLGVNVLWITSPIDNADGGWGGADGRQYSGYHGYWPRDLDAVESRLGSEEDLRAVVDAAHARGIRILIDYVMNHVHVESPLYADHPDWFWPNDNGSGGDCVCGGGCGWEGDQGRRCWFRSYLPDFDFTHPEARAWSIENALDWIEATGVDGFRLDAVKHIETSWLIELRERLREEIESESGEVFYLVGETYTGDRELIGSYVDPLVMLDGQFDFPLRADITRTVLRRSGSMNELALSMQANDEAYHPDAIMSTFIGNHDLPRVIHLAENQPLFDDWEDGKWRAWNDPPPQPDDAAPYERMALGFAILFTSPGIPLVYYGDEIGLAGAGDPDNRRFMQWEGWSAHQEALRAQLARLAAIRQERSALRRGTRTILAAEQDFLAYEMVHGDERVIVGVNRSDLEVRTQGIPGGVYDDLLGEREVTAPFDLEPRTAVVLVEK